MVIVSITGYLLNLLFFGNNIDNNKRFLQKNIGVIVPFICYSLLESAPTCGETARIVVVVAYSSMRPPFTFFQVTNGMTRKYDRNFGVV